MTLAPLLALLAGAAIAVQASMNAQLGVLLRSSILGTWVAFLVSLAFVSLALVLLSREMPTSAAVRSVPLYLWFSGGALSAFAISTYFYLIPQMGIGTMMSWALTGQVLVAMLAGHFGWFDLPLQPVNWPRLAGVAALVCGIVLINGG
ncbi:MAG: hypothetical protein CME59_23335 [Halioglobus sp.]|nr:hypothetical protein [Halioglobus sp.]|tara:strand:- start:100 stop:543 length:444 start_codon:yes stop_codon:yes gene_type:complete